MNPLSSAERREIDRHFRNRGSERRDQQNRTGDQIITAAKDLIRASRLGGITLVLGSGISVSRGLPDWNSLAQDLWRVAFGRRRSPWQTTTEGKSPLEVAQFLPIVFELAQEKLGKEKFLKALRINLYRNARPPSEDRRFSESHETLAVLARLVVQEFRRKGNRRIERIITLNADNLLEQAVFALVPRDFHGVKMPVLRPVPSPSWLAGRSARWPSIPVYHIHGYVPSEELPRDDSDYMLVFTDAQYWSTSATALAFANRVMLSALSESQCVFIGLSMTDINLLRWLALRTLEWNRDLEEAQRLSKQVVAEEMAVALRALRIRQWFSQHFWIRPRSDDPTGFLSKFLALRGIHSVELKNWTGPHFQRLMQECFHQEIPDKCRTASSEILGNNCP
jgi:NAD-dependent SIR2 family protein deacetylase